MNDLDEQLPQRLHDLAGGEPGTMPPTDRLLQRGRRARHRRAALASTSLAVVAAGAIAAVAVATHSAAPAVTADRPPATAASAASPQLELVAAIANSQNISFQLKTTTTGQKGDGKVTIPAYTYTTQSAFDPATTSGYLRGVDKNPFEIRLINGVRYMKNGEFQWWQYKGTYKTLNFADDPLRGQIGTSADGEQLFQALREGDAKVSKTGDATYHFEATGSQDGGTVKFVGDITLNGDKRIAKVSYDWTLTYKQGGFRSSKVVLEYSDYGAQVTVERPADPVLVD